MWEFYYYQLHKCEAQGNTIFRDGSLFQRYVVDVYASVEEDCLDYVRKNQKNLRYEIYQGIQDAITRGDTNAQAIGKKKLSFLQVTLEALDIWSKTIKM